MTILLAGDGRKKINNEPSLNVGPLRPAHIRTVTYDSGRRLPYGERAAQRQGVDMNPEQTATYTLVADGGKARLLRITGTRPHRDLAELEAFERPSAHQHVSELLSDKPGRTFQSSGHGGGGASHLRHGVGDDYDPHVAEVEQYVDRMLARLVTLHRSRHLGALVLIAEPQLLGVLRARLPAELQPLLRREISGDYVHADHRQLLELIDAPS
jgi:protein required for attachment to host cells